MSHKLNPYFQAGLDVMGQPCLIIGGGREAEEKSGRLLEAGANLTIVSTTVTPRLAAWAAKKRLTHHPRDFANTDLDGIFLVLNTVDDDPALTTRVYDLARAQMARMDQRDHAEVGVVGIVVRVYKEFLLSC